MAGGILIELETERERGERERERERERGSCQSSGKQRQLEFVELSTMRFQRNRSQNLHRSPLKSLTDRQGE